MKKKPTTASGRRWNQAHAELSWKARLDHKQWKAGQRRTPGSRRQKRDAQREGRVIECPEIYSLENNHGRVVSVLNEIRRVAYNPRESAAFDMSKIREISPTAALLTVAELDRLLAMKSTRLQPVNVSTWDPNVSRKLEEMGFFDFLQTTTQGQPEGGEGRTRYVRFETGSLADGEAFDRFQQTHLDPVFEELPGDLYAAVTEAMVNVSQHAYRDGRRRHRRKEPKRWWLSASFEVEERRMSVMICDLGQGIPQTLPRMHREQLRELIGDLGFSEFLKDDARMIRAAHELGRAASGEPHRGKGLPTNIRGYLDGVGVPAKYRVLSRRGEYVYETDGARTKESTIAHSSLLSGTLIVWELELQ